MVTRKELVVRGDQPEQQRRSEIARRTPQGLSEVSFEFDPEQLQRSFPPLSEFNQQRPPSMTTIIINGDYHAGGEAPGPGFLGYLAILIVLCVLAFGLAMLGVIHH